MSWSARSRLGAVLVLPLVLIAACAICPRQGAVSPGNTEVVHLEACVASDPYDVPATFAEEFRTQGPTCSLPTAAGRCSKIVLGASDAPPRDRRALFVTSFLEAALVGDNGGESLCFDILHDPGFAQALERVAKRRPEEVSPLRAKDWPALDEQQRGAALLFTHLDGVDECDEELTVPGGGKVHGAFDPASWRIKVYRSALSAQAIYGSPISDISVGFRYALVVGHELGHVLDALTGDLLDDALCASREDRATYYGTYLAECLTRVMRIALTSLADLRGEDAGLSAASIPCAMQRWSLYGLRYAQLRIAFEPTEIARRPAELNETQAFVGCLGL
jgi:hypothetical protein